MTNEKHLSQETATTSGGTRPMKVIIDNHGNEWLCDRHADANSSLADQGCWNSNQMAFDRNF